MKYEFLSSFFSKNLHIYIQISISIGDQITPPDCKNPWKNFRRDFCIRFYFKSNYKTTFDSAQAECKEQDGTLFEPRSAEGKFNFFSPKLQFSF